MTLDRNIRVVDCGGIVLDGVECMGKGLGWFHFGWLVFTSSRDKKSGPNFMFMPLRCDNASSLVVEMEAIGFLSYRELYTDRPSNSASCSQSGICLGRYVYLQSKIYVTRTSLDSH